MRTNRTADYDETTTALAELIVDGLTDTFAEIDPNRKTPAHVNIYPDDYYQGTEIIVTTPDGRRFELRLMEILQ
jgi:hypothetical protein